MSLDNKKYNILHIIIVSFPYLIAIKD